MFKITTETVHKIMCNAVREITKNPIHYKWLLEYNLGLAFSSHVSWIVAKDYDTVLDDKEFNLLVRLVCEHYVEYMVTEYER